MYHLVFRFKPTKFLGLYEMKNLIQIVCLIVLFTSGVSAQKKSSFNYDYEIIYQYTFKPNKNDSTKISEQTVLFCNDKDFYFTSVKNYQQGYTIDNGGGAQLVAQTFSGSYKMSSVTHYVFAQDKTYTTLERANNRSFSYEGKPDLKWEIFPDTMNIKGYSCQKAALLYGGRKWTAWFAADIPLSMGPYKFIGLPGLILKVADDQSQFSWELASFNKVKTSIPWVYFYNTRNHENVTKKEYFDYRIKRVEDPYTYDMILNPKISKITSSNLEAAHKAYNKKVKSKLVEDNWIEIE